MANVGLFLCYKSCVCLTGTLVGDDDIDSSPTFELIVKGEEAEEAQLESSNSSPTMTTGTSSVAETVDAVTVFANKRLRLTDADIVHIIPAASDGSTTVVYGTGLCRPYIFQTTFRLFCCTYYYFFGALLLLLGQQEGHQSCPTAAVAVK